MSTARLHNALYLQLHATITCSRVVGISTHCINIQNTNLFDEDTNLFHEYTCVHDFKKIECINYVTVSRSKNYKVQ